MYNSEQQNAVFALCDKPRRLQKQIEYWLYSSL